MQDKTEKHIFFSSLGKRTYNNNKIKKYYLGNNLKKRNYLNNLKNIYKEVDESFLEKGIDIFDNSFQNNKIKSMKNIHNFSFLINDNEAGNKYEYYKIHMQRLKESKREKCNKNNKAYQKEYEPKINYIKKRIIIGPKWDLLSGREEIPKKDKSTTLIQNFKKQNNLNTKLINLFKRKRHYIGIKKPSFKKLENYKDRSLENNLNYSKIKIKREISTFPFKTSFCNKINSEKVNKKKAKHFQSKSMINLNFNSFKSKVYKLDNITLKDKSISKYISPANLTLKTKTAQQKKV